MKIYIVSDGHYSNYRIEAVFTDKKLAEEFKAEGNFEYLEEWEADKPKTEWHMIAVWMDREGSVRSTEEEFNASKGFYGYAWDSGKPRWLVWTVETTEKERAIKVVNEKRTQIIANNAWADETKTRELFALKSGKETRNNP